MQTKSKYAMKKQSLVRTRIEQYAESKGYSFTAFEKACGFKKGCLLREGGGANTTTLERIVERFPKLNLNWVVTGRGEMEVEEKQPSDAEPQPPVVVGSNDMAQTVVIGNMNELGAVIAQAIREALS